MGAATAIDAEIIELDCGVEPYQGFLVGEKILVATVFWFETGHGENSKNGTCRQHCHLSWVSAVLLVLFIPYPDINKKTQCWNCFQHWVL